MSTFEMRLPQSTHIQKPEIAAPFGWRRLQAARLMSLAPACEHVFQQLVHLLLRRIMLAMFLTHLHGQGTTVFCEQVGTLRASAALPTNMELFPAMFSSMLWYSFLGRKSNAKIRNSQKRKQDTNLVQRA